MAEVVVGDLVLLEPGDQVIADGRLLAVSDLRLDESILTGESEPVRREVGDEVRSGAFVAEGTGAFEVSAVGADSFAARLTGEARSFRHPRSPLERAVNRLLYALVALVIGLGALLGYSLYHRHVTLHTAVATSAAGVVSLIPEGLMVLVSLTYAAAAVRMSRRGVLAQQLNAIESLASVDTICVDKTGTLTEAALRVVELLPAPGVGERSCGRRWGRWRPAPRRATSRCRRSPTPIRCRPQPVLGEVPFSSRRRWSAVALRATRPCISGRPGGSRWARSPRLAEQRQQQGRRVLALARDRRPVPSDPQDTPPPGLEPLGLVVLAEELRPERARHDRLPARPERRGQGPLRRCPADRGGDRARRRHSGLVGQRG